MTELASTRFGESHEIHKTLQDLQKNHYISAPYSDDVRSKFVSLQFLFESTIASMTKYQQALKVVGVIHTQTPSTPLRTNGNNIDKLFPTKDVDPKVIDSVVLRFDSIRDYLRSGAPLYSIYKKTNDQIKGIDFYKENLKNYKNLVDMPSSDFQQGFSGASYIVECKDGQKILFSIVSTQIDSTDNSKEWEIYYGSLEDDRIYNHFLMLKDMYNKYGVNFDF